MNPGMRTGLLASLVGFLLLMIGVFGFAGRCARPDVPCPSPSPNQVAAYLGLVLLVFGVVVLIRSGWRGSALSWVLATAAVVPTTWFVYEMVRQSPGMPEIGFLEEMTAPVLSATAALIVIVMGVIRARGRRGSEVQTAGDAPGR